jgi:CubicO group peptidase (beta-lactamase class C family)
MKRALFFLMGVVCTNIFSNPEVDRLFKDFDKPNVPGASVGIFKNGEIVYEKAFGLANLETKEAATPLTNYRLASLSKQFTAMAAMILIDEGKLTLETKVSDVISDFPSYASNIRVRHLLGHIGGLRDYEGSVSGSGQVSDYDVLKIYQNMGSSMFSAGSSYHYSNGGFVMLGLLVEKASGQNYGDFLRTRIFEKLGMTNSVLMQKEVSIPHRAYGYSPSGGDFHKTDQSSTSATRGDGCVYTSVREWLLWERALLNSTLVRPELQKLAFTPGTLNSGSKTSYGFGWMLGEHEGEARQYHTGSTIGFRTGIERVPSSGLAVVVLANRANSEPWNIARRILDMYGE